MFSVAKASLSGLLQNFPVRHMNFLCCIIPQEGDIG